MTTTTHFVDCPAGEWTELVDGSAYASCGLQADGAMVIAVAASAPAVASGGYISLCHWPMLTLTLGTDDKVYGQPRGVSAGGVRLYKTAVA